VETHDSSSLVRVFTAGDPTEAQIVRDMLADAGIDAVVQGTNLWMARGELGLGAGTMPTVWVHGDAVPRARELIEKREQGASSDKPAWTCSRCGETIDGQFTDCWQCAASGSGAAGGQ